MPLVLRAALTSTLSLKSRLLCRDAHTMFRGFWIVANRNFDLANVKMPNRDTFHFQSCNARIVSGGFAPSWTELSGWCLVGL